MAAQLSTDMRLQQVQVLAPQLQQSLKILQLPTMELQGLLSQQVATNPALEVYDPANETENRDVEAFDPDTQDQQARAEARTQSVAEDARGIAEAAPAAEQVCERELDEVTANDESWEEHYDASNDYTGSRRDARDLLSQERRPEADEEYAYRLQSIPSVETLADDLREQYMSLELSAAENEIFDYLIGSLDSSGFLKESAEEIAAANQKDPALVQQCIDRLKTFEPRGIGARDLQECLLIQLAARGREDTLPYRVIKEHYQDLLHNRRERITHGLGVTMDALNDAVREIGRLDPRPGRDLSTNTPVPIRADLVVTRRDDGSYAVEMNDNLLPYVRINPKVRQQVRQKLAPPRELSSMRQQIKEGELLINNLQFRKRTVLAVGEAIVERQKEFLDEGPTHLRPLTMKEIADVVGVHEATISRTVNEKYMDTPQGLYEMRHFFSSPIVGGDHGDVSTNAVKAKLQEMIAQENTRQPISDDKLAAALRQEGFPVARRTVVKYRQALGIPNARQRKVFG